MSTDPSTTALGRLAGAALAVAIGASLLTQLLQQLGPTTVNATRIHMALAGSIVALGLMRSQRSRVKWLLHAMVLGAFLSASYYFLFVWTRSIPYDVVHDYVRWTFTSILILVVLFYSYRWFGLPFAVLGALFVLYALFAHLAPGVLQGPENNFEWTFSRLSRSMFGNPFGLAAEFIWLLLFWGQMLTPSGAGPAVLWVSRKVARSTKGGAALGAALSSALAGSFTGAGAHNVVITGPITIPSMRRAGYTAEMAAAVEAVASNGAAITPPVLGTVAFIMANLLNMPIVLIVVMTMIPALLWYLAIGLHLVAHAHKNDLPVSDDPVDVPRGLLIRSSAIGIVPVSVMVYMVGTNAPLEKAVFYVFLTTVVLALTLRVETRLSVVWDAARSAAVSASAVSLTLAVLALVINVIWYTALGSRLDELIDVASGGVALIALGLMVIVAAVLAGPLPPAAMYIIMVITFAPVLTRMGVPYQASHFVAFYMGSLGTIVPPIAQSTLMASVIAKTSYGRANVEVLKLAWPLFALPVLFVAAPELLLVAGGPTEVGTILSSAGLALLAYAAAALATVGWLFVRMGRVIRTLASAVPLLVFFAMYTDNAAAGISAVLVAAVVVGWQWWSYVEGMQARGISPSADGALAGVSVRAIRGVGYLALGLTGLLIFAWFILVISPLAPGNTFRYASGIEAINRSINQVFLVSGIAVTGVGGMFLALARWRSHYAAQ